MKNVLSPITIILLFAAFIFSCGKDSVEVDNETQSVIDNAIAEQEFMAVPLAVIRSAITKTTTTCDTLAKISGDTYTMSVSDTVCADRMPDGKIRSGSLVIRLTGALQNAGTLMIVKFKNYKANNISFSCDSMIVTMNSLNATEAQYSVKLVNGKCSAENFTVKYKMNKTVTARELTSSNPYMTIYGTAEGVNRQNRTFTVNILQNNSLTKHYNCAYIDKGILELTPEGFKTRTVDFGNGVCDDNATFSVNGNTIAFKLK